MRNGTPFTLYQLQETADLIAPHIRRTKLKRLSNNLLIKAEHEQITGSFKARGALNRVLSIPEDQLGRGVVCASAGNHGLGVALACSRRQIKCIVVVPKNASKLKVEAIRKYQAEVLFAQGGYGTAESLGLQIAEQRQSIWVSPYNDLEVIQGQGTIGLEIANEIAAEKINSFKLYVPMSGGGLLSGVGLVMKSLKVDCDVIGVQTKAAPYLYQHLRGELMTDVDELPTIADGLAGPVEQGSITLDILPDVTDEVMVIGEDEIRSTIRWLFEWGEVVEPSAAVAVAAARSSHPDEVKIAIVSGGNIDKRLLGGILGEARP